MKDITGSLTPINTLSGEISERSGLSGDMAVPDRVGMSDYNALKNLPKIEGVELQGNKTFEELGMQECSNQDILNIFK